MKLQVRRFDIRTSTPLVVVIHQTDAINHDLHATDRVEVRYKNRRIIAVVDILDHHHDPRRAAIMQHGTIGLFADTADALGVKDGETITIKPSEKPESLKHIKRKIDGKQLKEHEFLHIVQDIVNGELTDIELTSFVTAAATQGLSFREVTHLTRAVATTGDRFTSKKYPIIDKHCIGGVPGNRTTMVVVPILAACGLTMPKTSSRAITSPAGTADTMECLANVSLSLNEMRKVVQKTNGCMVWGGAINLAPADDKIIRIERPLSIDVTGLMLSSVMAKKYSVSATHVIIDIPYGIGAKIATKREAERLRKNFLTIGKLLGMKMLVILTDGSQPIGNGVGPVLEAIDVMQVLGNDVQAPNDLKKKAISVAGSLLEFIGHTKNGKKLAKEILESGEALKKMQAIIDAQGRRGDLQLSPYKLHVRASKGGIIKGIMNKSVTKVCRLAGAPVTRTAGMFLHKKVKNKVVKGDLLFTVYAGSKEKLAQVRKFLKEENPYLIKNS